MSNPLKSHTRLAVNAFDRVTSLLLSLLILVGLIVAALAILFLFRKFSPEKKLPELVSFTNSRAEPAKGEQEEIKPPGQEDAPKDIPPQLQETLQEITTTVTSVTAPATEVNSAGNLPAGNGEGPTRSEHDGPDKDIGTDPPKELRFEARSDADYAAMIDSFGGELAVLDRRTNKIHYAKNLNQAKPTTREGSPPDDRFYFRATGPPLAPIEVRLARKAGIMKAGALILVFYPNKVAQDIYAMELARAKEFGRTKLEEIDRTIFAVEKKGRSYVFNVDGQSYR